MSESENESLVIPPPELSDEPDEVTPAFNGPISEAPPVLAAQGATAEVGVPEVESEGPPLVLDPATGQAPWASQMPPMP